MQAILNLPMVTNPDHEGGGLDTLITEILEDTSILAWERETAPLGSKPQLASGF
jgi:hypothetical protein